MRERDDDEVGASSVYGVAEEMPFDVNYSQRTCLLY